jgi:hypothetical protein
MDCAAVIRIRYRDFWSGSDNLPGLHGVAVRRGSRVTVYLQPGLTARQRTAVFRRLRQEASRGCGPELPLPRLMLAVGVDRLRTALRVLGGAIRLHPGVTLLPSALAVLVMTMFVLASAGGPGVAPPTGGISALASDQTSAARPPAVTAQRIAAGGRGLDLADQAVPAVANVKAATAKAACAKVKADRHASRALKLACRRAASYKAHRPRPRNLA